jgi:D-sedoheptulose 7-phosphate isomerase
VRSEQPQVGAQADEHVLGYLAETAAIVERLDVAALSALAQQLIALKRRGGRLFVVGSGGGAAHASHAVGDFRKLAGIEAYTPSDNAAELTARVNDDGWESSYVGWLKGSRLRGDDLLLVLSVGGGDRERQISANLVSCIDHARVVGAPVCGIVGRDGGHTARVADVCVVVPTVNDSAVTPHTEGMQAVLWHLLVSHPGLQSEPMKWESVS